MESSEVMLRVKKVIAQVLKMEASSIDDNANFVFDLGADSMQSVALVAGLEQEFGIEMEEDKALQVQTVTDAVKFIQTQLPGK
jgi:acyl carrier protein